MAGLGNRVRLGHLKFLYRDPLWFDSVRIVHEFVEKHIDTALAAYCNSSFTDSGAKERRHERYILLNEMVKQTQDKLDLRSQLLAVFMPSRDTTAFLVSNALHALSRHPACWSRLRKEILTLGTEPLTFSTLKSIKYLQWVINESTRSLPLPSRILVY